MTMTRKSWIGVVVAGLLLAACGGGSDAGDGHSGPDEGVEAPVAADQAEGRALAGDEVAVGAAASTLPGVGPSVIKTAEIALEIERGEFKAALQQATAVASAAGGFVLSSGVEGREARRGSIVLRIPSDRFEVALASLRDLGSVGRERVSGEDVGQEFVDLEARLRNLRAQEAVLLRLMNEAQTVTDTIRVQKELTGIQLEVEQIRGRLRYLHDQASFGTISVSMAEAGVVVPGEPGIIAQAWERAVEGFLAVIGGVITALGVLVPIAVLALLGWVVIRRRLPAKA